MRLPQTVKPVQLPSTEVQADQSHAQDIMRIQRDLARRRDDNRPMGFHLPCSHINGLPIRLDREVEDYGILTRMDEVLWPAVADFIDAVAAVAGADAGAAG